MIVLNKDNMDKDNPENTMQQQQTPAPIKEKKPDVTAGIHVRGHIKIHDPKTGEVFVDKPNAIHYENISVEIGRAHV